MEHKFGKWQFNRNLLQQLKLLQVLPITGECKQILISIIYGQGTENSFCLQQKLKNVGHQFGDLWFRYKGKISFGCVASSVCTFWEEACGTTHEGEEEGERLQFTSRQPRQLRQANPLLLSPLKKFNTDRGHGRTR